MKNKIVFMLIFLLLSTAVAAVKTSDQKVLELEKKLEQVSGKEKVDVLIQLASFLRIHEPDKCIEYCNQVLELSKKISYPIGRARALILMSYAHSVLGKREKLFEYCKEALNIFENLTDKKGMAQALNAMGYFYLRMDYFNIALKYFLRALRIYEEIGSRSNIVYIYWDLGNLYINLKDFDQALSYFKNALTILEETGKEEEKAEFFHNIGIIYQHLENDNKALEYFQKALKIFEDTGNQYWTAAALANIGTVYGKRNNNKKALEYLFKSQKIQEKLGNEQGIFFNMLFIGDIYLKKKKDSRALSYYEQAFQIAIEMKDKSSLEKIYKSYSDLYTARGDYKKALAYYKLYSETEDDLINAEKNKQIAELQEQFEAERRAKEIDILKKDNKIQKITRNAFIIGFILVLIILILLFKKYLYLFSFWKKQKYIGHYRIIETIGSGGMGTIYHAHSLRDKTQSAAIKVLKDELTKDENNRQRFKHEGTIIDKLDHPNIIKIYERGEYKEKLYLAMEFLQGKTLAQKMEEEGKIDLKECLYIMVQITDALVLIHSKNIVHRDLKPSNIMLIEKDGDPNFVKLLDFGLAKMKFQTRLTSTGILIGTINYVAPEQITDSLYSSASDIYALGIIFYQMITGNQAFSGDTITNIVEKILDTKPLELNRIRSEIPGELNHLITQMLSKKPGQRPLAEKVLTSLKKISNDFG